MGIILDLQKRKQQMEYIYKEKKTNPKIRIYNCDYREKLKELSGEENIVCVTDPPFNIGYKYDSYKDKLDEGEYYRRLSEIAQKMPCVFIHYPEQLHRLSVILKQALEKVASWIYNSNTPRQHRDIAWYGIKPNFKNAWQPYKNLKDKRIQKLIARGKKGSAIYDWWEVQQVKNISAEKTEHPCQMPMAIMKNIIATLPEGTTIFEPFLGSGTTALAGWELGYDVIGCEIDSKYFDIARQRIEKALWE